MGVEFLGELPLDPQVRIGGDTGSPVTLKDGSDPQAAAFHAIAKRTLERVQETGGPKGPSISIEE